MHSDDKIASFSIPHERSSPLSTILMKKDLLMLKMKEKNVFSKHDQKGQKEHMCKQIAQIKDNSSDSDLCYQFPKINRKQNLSNLNGQSNHKYGNNMYTNILDKKVIMSNHNLSINFLKSSVQFNPKNTKDFNLPEQKRLKTQKKLFNKRIVNKVQVLSRDQRYFEVKPVEISAENLKLLGYYEASNIYKPNNVKIQLDKSCLITHKYDNHHLKSIVKADIFLTNLKKEDLIFKMQDFVNHELHKEMQHEQTVNESNSRHHHHKAEFEYITDDVKISADRANQESKHIITEESSRQQTVAVVQNNIYITIKDYQFINNEEYKWFKIRNLNNWGEILYNFQSIRKCLKSHKISYFKIKSDKLLKWSGKKYLLSMVNQDFGLKVIEKEHQKIVKYCISFIDRMKVKRLKEKLKKKESLARWVCQRIKVMTLIRKQQRQKIQRAYQMHRKLIKNMQWDIEIHICSFSIDNNKRSTSQYIDSFENIYHQIWNNNSKDIVLVIPALNQYILKLLQNKIKIKKNITIICPEVYEIFPINMCLTAQVLFSYETLKRLSSIIQHKKAVIIPGHYENNRYELLLSQYLNAPLLCSLEINNDHSDQKTFFDTAAILNPNYCIIEPQSTYEQILDKFAQLLISNPTQKKWILKLNKEFNGRGIATIQINPSKYINQQTNAQKSKAIIWDHLRSFFKLKIKINYENSLYMIDNYIKELQLKGGIIEQQIKTDFVYEISLKKHKSCAFKYLYQVYGINYSNKIWLSCEPQQQILRYINSIQQALDKQAYYGYITVTICKSHDNQYFGTDIKLYPTYSANMVSFIKMIEERRVYTESSALNISNLKTIRAESIDPHQEDLRLSLSFSNYKYLLIPNLIFTDIQEEDKAKIIEEMMQQCWTDKHVKLHQQCRLYMSLGIDLSLILMGKDIKKLKKQGIDCIRELKDRLSTYRKYRGKQLVRDVFHHGDIIRSINKIKQQQ